MLETLWLRQYLLLGASEPQDFTLQFIFFSGGFLSRHADRLTGKGTTRSLLVSAGADRGVEKVLDLTLFEQSPLNGIQIHMVYV